MSTVGARPELDLETTATPPLTPVQRERRRRIIDAAMELTAEGDLCTIGDLAHLHGVVTALGTLYRYFASKERLLVARWMSRSG